MHQAGISHIYFLKCNYWAFYLVWVCCFCNLTWTKSPQKIQKKFGSIWQVHQWLFFKSEKCRTWILTLSTPAALNAFCKIFQFCMNSCSWLEANLTLLILTQSFKKKGKVMSILMGKLKNLTDLLLWIIMFVKDFFALYKLWVTSILHSLAQLVTF